MYLVATKVQAKSNCLMYGGIKHCSGPPQGLSTNQSRIINSSMTKTSLPSSHSQRIEETMLR